MDWDSDSDFDQLTSSPLADRRVRRPGTMDYMDSSANSAKTTKVGFLHLPSEIRNRIYRLAIYDHDRSVVFLPRNHPRKVVPDIDDVDVVYSYDIAWTPEEYAPTAMEFEVMPVCPGSTAASGGWTATKALHAVLFQTLNMPLSVVKDMTDREILQVIEDAEGEEWSADHGFRVGPVIEPGIGFKNYPSAHNFVAHDTDTGCPCRCHSAANISRRANDAIDVVSIGSDEIAAHGDTSSDTQAEEATSKVTSDEEEDAEEEGDGDRPCTCCQLEPDSSADYFQSIAYGGYATIEDIGIFRRDDLVDGDDYEHFDSEERMGMLYEPKEPSILLASHDIRSECQLVYYGRNAFSWRFQWTNYKISRARFDAWTRSVPLDGLTVMSNISFQGRHVHDEGVEYEIDIDLLDEFPYYTISVEGPDDTIEATSQLEQETDTYLTLLLSSQSGHSRPLLTATHLRNLAHIFVASMHYDPQEGFDTEARARHLMLNNVS